MPIITRTQQELNEQVDAGKLDDHAFIWVPENEIPVYTSAPDMLKALTGILNRLENIQPKYRDKRENDIINEVKLVIDKATESNRLTDEA